MFALREGIGAKQVSKKHFEKSIKESRPSISQDMIDFYSKITDKIKAEAAQPKNEMSYVG
jgi:transitional endoplasmic reticulum ATPase